MKLFSSCLILTILTNYSQGKNVNLTLVHYNILFFSNLAMNCYDCETLGEPKVDVLATTLKPNVTQGQGAQVLPPGVGVTGLSTPLPPPAKPKCPEKKWKKLK